MAKKLSAQERVIALIRVLKDNHIGGLSNKEAAAALGTSAPNACRDLALLESAGWAARWDTDGRWRLTEKFGGIAGTLMKSYQTAKLRLTEEEARYASAMQ